GEPIYRPLVGSKVTLSKGISNEVVGEGVTREEGKFDFRDVPPGSYFLQVEPPPENNLRWMQASGYIPIEVAPHSQVSSLNLALTMAVCGSNAYEQLERNDATNAQAH
ncbi:MAG: carboxypeptidase-like regulatory domain-containing protein, partial [Acidobacteriia bacterium]|nr:carboxypeptidase-like regulatory domain-containing protein [Terriglobia bacterium]